MERFLKIYGIEQKLFFRSADVFVFNLCMPVATLVLIAMIAGGKAAGDSGMTYLQSAFSSLISVGICCSAFMSIPIVMVDYRDKKILKQFYCSPVSPACLLGADTLCSAVMAAISALSVFGVSVVCFGYRMQGNVFTFIAAALDLVREKGMQALTARDIGNRLGISARPVFTAFKNMEEVQQEVRKAARNWFKGYAEKAVNYSPAFKQMGMQMILFAKEEPRLYELLFVKNDGAPHFLEEGYLSRDEIAASSVKTIQKDYGLTYVTGGCLPVVILRPETEWQKSALDLLKEINVMWDNNSVTQNEYLITTKIVTLWYILISNLSDESKNTFSVDLARRERLQIMLSFIYEHFSEDIALANIACIAHISIGECCRIFREHLQTTPYQFLTEYRVRKSVELLSGELSISEIAGRCGYNQTSNYIAKFKSIMDCTPAQYRKHRK